MKSTEDQATVIIVGGGFGGLYAAVALEKHVPRGAPVRIVLVSRENFFLFTPLLAEVASSFIETRHAVNPIRRLVRRSQFLEGEVEGIDPARRALEVRDRSGRVREMSWDHLVLAPGSVPDFFGIKGMGDHAFSLKTLGDAVTVRNHVIDLLEQADVLPREERGARLTFAVIGGGLNGIEVAGELHDFVVEALQDYKNLKKEDVRMVLVEAIDRLAYECPEDLGRYAERHLKGRGMGIWLSAKVNRAQEGAIWTEDGRHLEAGTIIWTAGVRANPLTECLPVDRDYKGRVPVDEYLRVPEFPGLWVVGDAAKVSESEGGGVQPPTAQHAVRQGASVGENIARSIQSQALKPYRYKGRGMLATLGHYRGIGRVFGFQVRGFLAWFLWRTYYLFTLPRWERRLRVAFDWTLDLLFRPDIVQLKLHPERFGKEK